MVEGMARPHSRFALFVLGGLATYGLYFLSQGSIAPHRPVAGSVHRYADPSPAPGPVKPLDARSAESAAKMRRMWEEGPFPSTSKPKPLLFRLMDGVGTVGFFVMVCSENDIGQLGPWLQQAREHPDAHGSQGMLAAFDGIEQKWWYGPCVAIAPSDSDGTTPVQAEANPSPDADAPAAAR